MTRAVPQPPSIRQCMPGPAIGPVPDPGAPPYGAPLYGPGGVPLFPGVPPAPQPDHRRHRHRPATTGGTATVTLSCNGRKAAVKDNLAGAAWRFAIFTVVCLVATFAAGGSLRAVPVQRGKTYHAEFTNVTGLKTGNLVSIAGVEVGKVKTSPSTKTATVGVEFSADDSVTLTKAPEAAIR